MSLISLDCNRPLIRISIFLLLNYEANLPWKFDIDYLKNTTDILTIKSLLFTNLSDTKTRVNVMHSKCSIKGCWFGMKQILVILTQSYYYKKCVNLQFPKNSKNILATAALLK